ncbi:dynein light chain LC6, flagellar outer arm-like [Mya arenaria]|uniref:dynein light chain LC6, flagellar outer arm-like n=1 Tax=Mya arenaria TaxID=6604 RepID=UPI0022E5BD88|nr:dynein light chain LC6, flagellar outer arm-like [Mya arenaria]
MPVMRGQTSNPPNVPAPWGHPVRKAHSLIFSSRKQNHRIYPRLLDHLEASMSERKAVIKNADMSEDMQQDAVDCATQALEKFNIEKDIAAFIKKEFDKKYNPTWHAIVGRNFGSYVTHETKHFIYFYLGQVAILLFKSG